MTALFIPNAIQISTRNTKYTFTSFMARDTTYDVIFNVWRLVRPAAAAQADAASSIGDGEGDGTSQADGNGGRTGGAGATVRKATQCTCGKEGKHYSQTAMDITIPGTPEKIYNLMFASGFIKDFMREDQKLMGKRVLAFCHRSSYRRSRK
jgi:hypothetical protein